MKMEMVKMLEMLKTALRRGHKKLTQRQQVDEVDRCPDGWGNSCMLKRTPSYPIPIHRLGSEKRANSARCPMFVITCIVNADKQWMALR